KPRCINRLFCTSFSVFVQNRPLVQSSQGPRGRGIAKVPDIRSWPCRGARVVPRTRELGPGNSDERIRGHRIREPAVAPRLSDGAKPGLARLRCPSWCAPRIHRVIVAASTITGIFFKLPAGALSDVLGRKRMMVLGAVFFAAPPFLYPFVGNPWTLLALRFVHGFATAIFSPVASAYVASLAETARGARLG